MITLENTKENLMNFATVFMVSPGGSDDLQATAEVCIPDVSRWLTEICSGFSLRVADLIISIMHTWIILVAMLNGLELKRLRTISDTNILALPIKYPTVERLKWLYDDLTFKCEKQDCADCQYEHGDYSWYKCLISLGKTLVEIPALTEYDKENALVVTSALLKALRFGIVEANGEDN